MTAFHLNALVIAALILVAALASAWLVGLYKPTDSNVRVVSLSAFGAIVMFGLIRNHPTFDFLLVL